VSRYSRIAAPRYARGVGVVGHGLLSELQGRFLNSSGQHVTNVYDMCSLAVSYGVHSETFLACNALQAAP
jgi:hypothetical protein